MLNDLSLAFYTGDVRYKKHVDIQISLYEVLSLTTEAMAIMIAFDTFKNSNT